MYYQSSRSERASQKEKAGWEKQGAVLPKRHVVHLREVLFVKGVVPHNDSNNAWISLQL